MWVRDDEGKFVNLDFCSHVSVGFNWEKKPCVFVTTPGLGMLPTGMPLWAFETEAKATECFRWLMNKITDHGAKWLRYQET